MTSKESELFSDDDIYSLRNVDLYNILCINKESFSKDIIKKKFKKLILQYHPDKNPSDKQAANKFILIEIAYKILADPKLKIKYDNCYEEKEEEDDDFETMKSTKRDDFKYEKISEKNFEEQLRNKNLEMDPDFYDNKRFTDEEFNNLINENINERNKIAEELKIKYKNEAAILSSMTNKDEQHDYFNTMFNKTRSTKNNNSEVMLYGGNAEFFNSSVARVDQYNTMFSDDNTQIENAFEINNVGFVENDEDMLNGMSFEDYQKQYIKSLVDLSAQSVHSTLKNGRADFKFDT